MLPKASVTYFTLISLLLVSIAPASLQPALASAQATPPQAFVLQDGTPIKLRLARNLSSAEAHTGEQVDFDVLEEIRVNNVVVIPKGATALGTVTEAQAKRRMARGGKLNVNIDYVRLADGEKAALRAVKQGTGGGHTGAMTGAMVATSLVVWPAAPFFLFMHGKDITLPKGTEISAYVNGDMSLDAARFQGAGPSTAPAATPISNEQSGSAELEVASTPSGADIEIDGKFIGSTPSTVGISAGEHRIVVKKSGFSPWTREMTASSGHVKISAELER